MTKELKKNFSDAQYDAKTAQPKSEFQIFVDMDGVLSDFVKHAFAQDKMDAKGDPKWNELDYNWWVTMPAFEGMKEFYAALKKTAATRILTAPSVSDECFRAKAEWVKNHWDQWMLKSLIICSASDKQFLARPNHILIDDRQKNVDEWREAGGIAILHTGDYAATLKQVDVEIAAYRKRNLPPPRQYVDL